MPSNNYCLLSEEDANKLRCTICNGYLSVGPVKMSLDGTLYQCGRCNFDVANINVINFTYEKLAHYLRFPCNNEGCEHKLLWKDVEQHEMACPYRKIKCPKLDCEHMLENCKIMSHFEELHKDLITRNMISLTWPLDNSDVSLGILIHDGRPYIYLIDHSPRSFRISIYSLESTIDEKYKLRLCTPTNEVEISVHGGAIFPYDDRKHCMKCFLEKCTSKLHEYSTNYGHQYEMTTELEATGIRSILQSKDVIYCEVFIETNEKRNIFDNSSIIRKTVECPICTNYMLPPIYNCSTGHIICNACKENLPECPTCKAGLVESRNYTVEELSENIILPCHSNKEGCKFIGNPKTLRLHEEMCRQTKK